VTFAQPASRHRLLIVDDQPTNVRVMAEALKDDYEICFATTGEKAIELASAHEIDLVLLDVVMPDLDGFEVCRRLKSDERTSRIPIIFVTSREEVEDETRGFDVGGIDYITKPIRPPIVKARIRTHLELKESRDLLEELASIDPLTSVANRRRFNDCLDREWQRAQRFHHPLSIAVVDVDFFKKYNDTYGHARGDECLRAVAQALVSAARRPGDLVARCGGEEFALILPETTAAGMKELMKALLSRVSELAIPHHASSCADHVTISIGAVTCSPANHGDAAAVLELADQLLYEAKEAGRNQCVHIDSDLETSDGVTPPRVRIPAGGRE
jgi:diguanylate cyclase (GGDEF)-like protein